MAYVLGKRAGLTLGFASCDQELPDSPLYLLPLPINSLFRML